MYYFSFLAIPKHDNPKATEFGGAYVNCWLNGSSGPEAELEARVQIDAHGWVVDNKEDEAQVSRTDYDERPESLARFDEAQLNGSCYVFHTFPSNDTTDAGDEVRDSQCDDATDQNRAC